MIMASGKRGLSVASDVPQLPQNNRVRGVSRSVRANVFGSPCVNVRLARQHHGRIGIAAADVLAFSAVALNGGARLAIKGEFNLSAIAASVDFHGGLLQGKVVSVVDSVGCAAASGDGVARDGTGSW